MRFTLSGHLILRLVVICVVGASNVTEHFHYECERGEVHPLSPSLITELGSVKQCKQLTEQGRAARDYTSEICSVHFVAANPFSICGVSAT